MGRGVSFAADRVCANCGAPAVRRFEARRARPRTCDATGLDNALYSFARRRSLRRSITRHACDACFSTLVARYRADRFIVHDELP